MEVKCNNCGSLYKVRKHKSPIRDKDSIQCEVCNSTLLRWNGGVYYTDCKLINKSSDHLKNN